MTGSSIPPAGEDKMLLPGVPREMSERNDRGMLTSGNSLGRSMTPTAFVVVAVASALAAYILAPDNIASLGGIARRGGFEFSTGPELVSTAFPFLLAAAPLAALLRPSLGLTLGVLAAVSVWPGASPLTIAGVVSLVGVAAVAIWRAPLIGVAAGLIAWVCLMVHVSGHLTLWVDEVTQIDLVYHVRFVDKAVPAVAWTLAVVGPILLSHLYRNVLLRAQRVETRERDVSETATVLGERARLARDLHDVVAHHVSLIAVRAETAPYADPSMPQSSRDVLSEIATDARSALDELRGVLGILQRSDGATDRSPLPGLDDVPGMVERARSAGDEVSLERTGGSAAPNAAVGYISYRVIQEALTNARKHAPGRPVSVVVDVSPDAVRLVVRNPAAASSGEGTRRGLIGMQERVEGVGGWFGADRRAGEFVVEARLPGLAK